MIPYRQIITVAAIVAFLALLYMFAYDKGYEKHRAEVAKQATEIIVDSRQDIITAAKEAQNAEKNIKTSVDCNVIWNFNIGNCLSN